jgi:hypothetical protein
VVTHGTPHELVNDQVAIDAYLGRSFEEDGFTRHFDARLAAAKASGAVATAPMSTTVPGVVPSAATASTVQNPVTTVPVDLPTAIPATPPVAVPATPTVPAALTPPPVAAAANPAAPAPSARSPQPTNLPPGSVITPPEAMNESAWPTAKPAPKAEPVSVGTSTPPPTSVTNRGAFHAILEMEKLRRAVENLTNDQAVKASAMEIVARGAAAIPVLLEAMERRDALLRQRAFEMLKLVAKESAPFDYDPNGTMEVVLRQVAYLRVRLEHRR